MGLTYRDRQVAVIGIGNVLCSDEGVGIHVINEFKRETLNSNAKIFDCGTSGIAVLEAMDGTEKAIIIDAVSSGSKPGTIHLYTMEDLLRMEDNTLKLVSLHQFDLMATLKLGMTTNAYKMPRKIIIIGVEVKSLESSMDLSDELTEALPKVIETVIHEAQAVD